MLERVSWIHHAVVGGAVLTGGVLAFLGMVGEADLPERFDGKQVVVSPAGGEGLRIREVIDQDFGSAERRGHERILPYDFGEPTDVTASSDTAPDDVSAQRFQGRFRIRIGDPDVTISGQHRYVLEYTLPEARLSSGELALDVIGTSEEFETVRFEVVVAGFDLEDPVCNVGRFGASGGCTLERDGDIYRTVIEPLRPREGITIGGTIVGVRDAAVPEPPPLPERRSSPNRIPFTVAMLLFGAVAVAAVYAVSVRRGRNDVYAGGAADAAFGTLPSPALGLATSAAAGAAAGADRATTSVTDRELAELATIEFAPPQGLEPWEGAVLLSERVDDDSVSAWFSGLAGREQIVLEDREGTLTLAWGPRRADLDAPTEEMLAKVLEGDRPLKLGTYDEKFAELWRDVRKRQDERIRTSGWWKHQAPQGGGGRGGGSPVWLLVLGLLGFATMAGSIGAALLGLLKNPVGALIVAVGVSAVVAWIAYSSLLPSRSAPGSALALRTESFRRFLEASEGQHVQWAWERGVLREYSAWAVALGAADAWSKALEASNVPPTVSASMTAPLLVHSMRSSFASATTAPSSSGSGGSGGGFSSGSVGGGGGGGSSGSW